MADNTKKATDEIICVNGKGKTMSVRRFVAEDKNWQRATGFRPQEIEAPEINVEQPLKTGSTDDEQNVNTENQQQPIVAEPTPEPLPENVPLNPEPATEEMPEIMFGENGITTNDADAGQQTGKNDRRVSSRARNQQ